MANDSEQSGFAGTRLATPPGGILGKLLAIAAGAVTTNGMPPASGIAVCATLIGFRSEFAFDRPTAAGYAGFAVLFTVALTFALDLFDHEARRKSAEARIHQMATHDPLTGLPNRILLLDRLAQALHSAHRKQRHVGVLFLDLDHFKTINDSLGHEVGDQLLQEVTGRLRHRIRQEDTLARQGGDEFILVLPDITNPAAAGQVAEHLLSALHEPFILNDQRLHIGASIGVSIYPLDATDPPTLIRFADSAMYQAKEAGRASYAFFTVELNHRVSERFALSNELRHALEANEFVLHYQPQFDLATGQLIGAEALIRWQHPERGLVPPIKFIPIAEETGLINAIGEWTLRAACAQNRHWQDAGLPAIPIAVNLSAKQWLQPHLEDQVIQALETAGLAPELLELEITESAIMTVSYTHLTLPTSDLV